MVAKKKAVARRASGNGGAMTLAQIKSELSTQAAGIKDRIGNASEGRGIGVKGKVFTFPDGSVVEDSIDVVILDFVSVNRFYDSIYKPDDPMPPVCYAIGDDPRNMVPSSNGSDVQAKTCNECPMNEYGTSQTGKGKACKNIRQLAVLPPDAVGPEEMICTLDVSPTALKSFDGYVSGITNKFELPPIAVVTTVSFLPNVDYPSLVFSGTEPNTNLQAHYARLAEARDLLHTEPDYQAMADAAAAKPKPRGRARATRRAVRR